MGILARKRILVVEDDPNLQAELVDALEGLGHAVNVAVQYDEVTRALVDTRPHVVVVSLNLPRNSGYDVCEMIRGDEGLAATQILITSDRASPAEFAFAEEAGANAFLRKPFTRAQLTKYLTALLDTKRPARPSVRMLRRSDLPPSS
jgi:DNA-binding response OmpR family regulator